MESIRVGVWPVRVNIDMESDTAMRLLSVLEDANKRHFTEILGREDGAAAHREIGVITKLIREQLGDFCVG